MTALVCPGSVETFIEQVLVPSAIHTPSVTQMYSFLLCFADILLKSVRLFWEEVVIFLLLSHQDLPCAACINYLYISPI